MKFTSPLITGLSGVSAMEIFEKTNTFLATAVVEASGATAEHAAQVAETIISTPTNPLALIDAIGKIVISVLTAWRLIIKPKPKDV